MPFWNFILDIFGGKSSGEPKTHGFFDFRDADRDRFRNPVWQNDEDDDDIEDFRHPRRGMQFNIYSDPLEITKYFEAQMENMLKSFMFGFNDKDSGTFMKIVPFTSPSQENARENLRDRMLKSNDADLNQPEQKVDTDLDGQITASNFSSIWGDSSQPQPRVIGKSIVKQFIRRPDGTIEQKQVFKDSEGNEEVTESQQIGDKVYTVITKRDKNGVETKTENFVNIDESEIIGKKWLPPSSNSDSRDLKSPNYFPWEKFFKPDPKL